MSDITNVFSLVGLALLVYKLTDLVKFVRAGDTSSVLTQIVSYGVGVAAVFLASAAAHMQSVVISGAAISDLNWADKVLVGTALASAAGYLYDRKKATDQTDSAVTPNMLTGNYPSEEG